MKNDEWICSKMFHQNPETLNVQFSVIEEEKHLKSNHIGGAGIREFGLCPERIMQTN